MNDFGTSWVFFKNKIKYGPFGTFTPPPFRVVFDLAYFFSRRK